MKTKTIISIITAGLLGTLANVYGDDTPVAPPVVVAMASPAPTSPTAPPPGAPAPPTGLTITAASAATLAAIPTNTPGGYYVSGGIRGYYININSPYWATHHSYGTLVYNHPTNSPSMNLATTVTQTNIISKSVTAVR